MITRTIFIYDSCGEEAIKFKVLDGDYSHLDKVYVNVGDYPSLEDEVVALFCPDGSAVEHMLGAFPHEEYAPGETAVVVVGFIP